MPFNVDKIISRLDPTAAANVEDIIVLPVCDSTNTYLLNQLKIKLSEKSLICIADTQTHGRGRQGKHWISPANANLYFSMSWPCQHFTTPVFSALSMMVGITVAQMLETLGVQDIQLKWPNDIVWRDKKLGGILLESITSIAQSPTVVIGIGLNIAMPTSQDNDIGQPWIDLNTILAQPIEREMLAAKLINHCVEMLSTLKTHGAESILAQWTQYDRLHHQAIVVKTHAGILQGIARGITNTGQLRLETQGQIISLSSAEILECRSAV